jgi:aryl sulfotransferase
VTIMRPSPRVSIPARRVLRNHSLDSTRWNDFRPRCDDVVVATSYKSGTTWMQMIVRSLFDQEFTGAPLAPDWLDAPRPLLPTVLEDLERQQTRRCIKTHLPLDALPFYDDVKYIVVARDARDVFMSLWHHHVHTILAPERRPAAQAVVEADANDLRHFWRGWTTRGWFPGETEGYPYWGNLRHTQQWWACKDLPSVRLVHFDDLLRDLTSAITGIAAFLAIEVTAETTASIAARVSFASVKKNARRILPTADRILTGGADTFFGRGTNGRWKMVLSAADLRLYDAAATRELSPDTRAWLERDDSHAGAEEIGGSHVREDETGAACRPAEDRRERAPDVVSSQP